MSSLPENNGSHPAINSLDLKVASTDQTRDDARLEMENLRTTESMLRAELGLLRKELDWARNEIERLRRDNERRKVAVRQAERTFQFRLALPAFLTGRRTRPAAQESGFEFQVESPRSWHLMDSSATVQGWCFSKTGAVIQAIRAVAGGKIYDGLYGRRRFDVQAVFPNHANADRCGFEVELLDLPRRFDVTLEILDDQDHWHTLCTVSGKLLRSSVVSTAGDVNAAQGAEMRRHLMTLNGSEQRRFKREVDRMTDSPLVSILMPVFNTPADFLREAIRSVKAQVYPHWQLCLVDDASTSEATARVLQDEAGRDARITLMRREENGGIATASNTALGQAKGSLIILMDHDDLLTPLAVLRVVQAAVTHGADFIYSDEGMMNSVGDFTGGTYRPAFSPSYLRSHPYIIHLVAFSVRLLRDIGGFTAGLRISQDYDVILRAVERASAIVHIPEVLYLWRQVHSSAGRERQPEVMSLSSGLLAEHLERCRLPADVKAGVDFNFFRVEPKLDLSAHSVAIIIPTKNQAALLRRCVRSLEQTLPTALRVRFVIVDHESDDDETRALLAELSQRHTVLPYAGSFNYAAINNFGVRHGAGDADFVLYCNNDIEAIEAGWMETLLAKMQDSKVGAVGPLLLYPDGESVQHAGVGVGLGGVAEHLGKFMTIRDSEGEPCKGYQGMLSVTREVAAITTGFALFRRQTLVAVGGFNEEFQVGFNDTDLCLRVWQAGYRVLYCGETRLLHHESASRGKSFSTDPHPADSRRFKERWAFLLEKGDPFYNPNLRLDSTSWESAAIMQREPKLNMRCYTSPQSMFQPK
jgi:O-antigen biosynthesis protein